MNIKMAESVKQLGPHDTIVTYRSIRKGYDIAPAPEILLTGIVDAKVNKQPLAPGALL